MKQTQWGKERRTSQTEVVIEGGKKKEKKKAGGNVCVCVCVRDGCRFLRGSDRERCEKKKKKLGRDGEPEKRQNVWMHLRASGDKKGSSGVRGLLLGLLIPRPSHPFRACLRSGSLALRADDPAPPADLICYVFLLPRLPPSTSTIIVPERDPRSPLQGAC